MRAFSISSDGNLAITASETSSKSDFDYLIGNWNIRNRTLKEPLTGSDEWKEFDATQEFRPVLLGLGNVDIFHTELDGSRGCGNPRFLRIPQHHQGQPPLEEMPPVSLNILLKRRGRVSAAGGHSLSVPF
jgi:hypothetical protein